MMHWRACWDADIGYTVLIEVMLVQEGREGEQKDGSCGRESGVMIWSSGEAYLPEEEG